MSEAKFYAVGDKEILMATSIEEAVDEFLEDNWTDDSPGDLSETVDVQGYMPKRIKSDCFEWCIDHLLGSLDENYAGEDPSEYKPSDEAMKHFDEFKRVVISEYPVWQCEEFGDPISVKISDYLKPTMCIDEITITPEIGRDVVDSREAE